MGILKALRLPPQLKFRISMLCRIHVEKTGKFFVVMQKLCYVLLLFKGSW